MNISDLYEKLKEAYTQRNLNEITAKIIEWNKLREVGKLRELSRLVGEYVDIEEKSANKYFSKLVMLYHPDKEIFYNKELDKAYKNNDFEKLSRNNHIFLIEEIEKSLFDAASAEDIDYSPQYDWDFHQDGFNYFCDYTDDFIEENPAYDEFIDNSFYSAVKRKIYGNMNIEMPAFYLEDIEEIEMAEYEIDNLDGIEHCKHATHIDLSKNHITDISLIIKIKRLEELYLSDNYITFIDPLYNLKNLRIIDLSNNNIEDISILQHLQRLEFLNIANNRIPSEQIEKLKKQGIVVSE